MIGKKFRNFREFDLHHIVDLKISTVSEHP
ncbi:hypothetical protein CH53_3491 [Yersinia intermedia]|nr:hypothetical protein CH53_3491 [Yersinia intermedia]